MGSSAPGEGRDDGSRALELQPNADGPQEFPTPGALREKTPRSKYGVLPACVKPTNSPRVRKALGREPFDAAG